MNSFNTFQPTEKSASNISSSRTAPIVQFTIELGLLANKVRQHTRGGTNKRLRQHHLDRKVAPARRSSTPISNQKNSLRLADKDSYRSVAG